MKRFAFLVLIFSVAVFAEDGNIKQWAESYETNEETVKMCLEQAESTETEMMTIEKQLDKLGGENMDDETKKLFDKYKHFMACMLEQKEMLKDSKLVVDKILEAIEKDEDKIPIDKDVVKQCLDELNDDNDMTREDRAIGAALCMVVGSEDKNKKK